MLVTGIQKANQVWVRIGLPVPLRSAGTFTSYAFANQVDSGYVHRHQNATDKEAISGTYAGQDSFQIYRSRDSATSYNYSIQSYDADAEL